jgi:hypothetical protein
MIPPSAINVPVHVLHALDVSGCVLQRHVAAVNFV